MCGSDRQNLLLHRDPHSRLPAQDNPPSNPHERSRLHDLWLFHPLMNTGASFLPGIVFFSLLTVLNIIGQAIAGTSHRPHQSWDIGTGIFGMSLVAAAFAAIGAYYAISNRFERRIAQIRELPTKNDSFVLGERKFGQCQFHDPAPGGNLILTQNFLISIPYANSAIEEAQKSRIYPLKHIHEAEFNETAGKLEFTSSKQRIVVSFHDHATDRYTLSQKVQASSLWPLLSAQLHASKQDKSSV